MELEGIQAKALEIIDLLKKATCLTFIADYKGLRIEASINDTEICFCHNLGGFNVPTEMEAETMISDIEEFYYLLDNDSWIALDYAGNYDHSETYKGIIRWDFGKQQFQPLVGWGIDTKGQWAYSDVPGKNGALKKNLIKNLLAPYQ
jgi:hypothetical protein